MTSTVTSGESRRRDPRTAGPGASRARAPRGLRSVVAAAEPGERQRRFGRVLVPALPAALAVAVVWLALYLPDLGRPAQQLASVLFAIGAGALAVTGGLLWPLARARSLAAVLLATGVLALAGRLVIGSALVAHQQGWAAATGLGWLSNWAWVPGQAAVMVLLLRYPSGRAGQGWRVVESAVLGWAVATVAVLALVPGPLGVEPLAPLTNPLGLGQPGPGWDAAMSAVFILMPILLLVCVVGVVARYVQARGPEREQLRLPALATVLLGLAAPVATLTDAGVLLEALAYVLLPWSIIIAVLRHRLFDVDVRRRLDRLRAAREDERRRLQHELHDGIGPILGAISMQAEATRNLIAAGAPSERVDAVLAAIGAQASEAAGEVRRLLDDLEDPFEEADLESTLRSRAGALHGGAVVECPDELGELSRPVERAALRIASEAVHNVARHARADWCRVSLLQSGGELVVEVADNGCGIGDSPPGIGRTSMSRRAEAVGGTLTVSGRAGGGTLVRAVLPLEGGGDR